MARALSVTQHKFDIARDCLRHMLHHPRDVPRPSDCPIQHVWRRLLAHKFRVSMVPQRPAQAKERDYTG